MRIVKYNKGQKADGTDTTTYNITEQLAMQITDLSNKLDSYFTLNEYGVLVSNYDLASTGQISAQYQQAAINQP